jgi:predicted SnoaL-like aldol condensation-catalyzing enzyme
MLKGEKMKDIAVNFLKLVISGNIDEAYEKYVDMNGKHHNMYFPAGFSSLKDAMKENHNQFPNKVFEIKNVIAEGTMAAVHSRLHLGDKQIAVVHLFKIENEKIVEMWDVGQEIPKELPNEDGAL